MGNLAPHILRIAPMLLLAEPLRAAKSSELRRASSQKLRLPRPGEGGGEATLPVGGVIDAQALHAGREGAGRSQLRVGRVLGLGELRQWPVRVEGGYQMLEFHAVCSAVLRLAPLAVVEMLDSSVRHVEVKSEYRDHIGVGVFH